MKEKLFTRNFTLLLVGQASSLLGNNTLKFALSMFVLEETGSATVFATILALAMAPTILLSPLGGILADRANRKSIMVALDSLSGLAVLLACLLLSLGDRMLVVGALLVALSILGAFESPTVQACVPQMLSGERLLQAKFRRPPLWSPRFWAVCCTRPWESSPSFWGQWPAFSSPPCWSAFFSWTIDVPAGRPGWALRCGKTSRKAWSFSSARSQESASCSCWPLW